MSSQYYLDDRPPSNPFFTTLAAGPNALSVIGTLFAGAYVLYKALELAGLPVGRHLEDFYIAFDRFVKMAQNHLPLLLPAPPSPTATAEDAQDSPSSPLSMFSSASGLISKGVRGVAGAFSRSPRKVPAGLGNISNSCYQNSVIQGLASLPSLREHLEKATSEYKQFGPESTYGALSDMIKQLNDPANHGQYFWIQGVLKAMDTVYQQDAQEYYSKVLDALDTEIKKAAKTKDEKDEKNENGQSDSDSAELEQQILSANPLDGLLAQRVGCVNCGYTEGLSLIPFNCITVPLGHARAYDIADCLNEYTHLEYIEDVECAKCTLLKLEATLTRVADRPQFAAQLAEVQKVLKEDTIDDKVVVKDFNMKKKYWVKTTKSRQCVVARAPKALVVHINRSMFDETTGLEEKNYAHVAYPRVLDLGPWCLGSRPSKDHKVDEDVEESWPRDPNQSMVAAKIAEKATPSPFQYALKAAVTHWGGHGNGHYICYRQHPFSTADDTENGDEANADAAAAEDVAEEEGKSKHQTSEEQWWRLSDTFVAEVPEEEAASQDNVFMLFYERIDGESAPVAAAEPETALADASADAQGEAVPSIAQEAAPETAIDPALTPMSTSSPLLAAANTPSQIFSTQPLKISDSSYIDADEALPTSPAKRQRLDTPQVSAEESISSLAAPASSESTIQQDSPIAEVKTNAEPASQAVDASFPSTTGTETSRALSDDTEMTEPSENGNDDGSTTGASTTLTSESGDDVEMSDHTSAKRKQEQEQKEKSKDHHPVMRTAREGSAGPGGESLPIVPAV